MNNKQQNQQQETKLVAPLPNFRQRMKRNLLSLAKTQLRFANEYVEALKTETLKSQIDFMQREIPRLKSEALWHYKQSKVW
jgi:phosphoenolpyruvate carboxylase